MKKFYTIIILFVMILVVKAEGQEFPLGAGFVLEGNPILGEEFTLHFIAKAVNGDVPAFRFSIEIPVGIEVLSDTTSFIVELYQGDSTSYPFKMRTVREGAYHIKGALEFIESGWKFFTEYFIISGQDTSLHNYERFEEHIYNMGADTIPEIPESFAPSDNNVTVTGTLRYYDNDEQNFVSIRDIRVKLYRENGTGYLETTTNNNGQYSLQPSPGIYYLQFDAKTSAGEVHPFWEVGYRFPWSAILDVSPNPQCFNRIYINVEAPGNYEFSYDFTQSGRPEWAKILRTISEIKSKVYNSTGGQTLDYIEVSYPTHAIGYYEPEGSFYAPAGMILEADLKRVILGVTVWYGFEVVYRNPHQIVLPNQNWVWGIENKEIITHEWAHAFMTECFNRRLPNGWGFSDEHGSGYVSNQGFAFSEGFGDFLAGAVWINELGTQITNEEVLEEFYANDGQPWYKGYYYNNCDGRIVEGAVTQFFWDLFDNHYTNDHTPNTDDDGVGENNIAKITTALIAMGTIMDERRSGWIYLPPEDPQVRFAVNEGIFYSPDVYNYTGNFKDKWHQLGPNVDELYNVVVHPFTYPEPFTVPAPTYLRTSNVTNNKIVLLWNDNAQNEGQNLIYRQREGQSNWDVIVRGPNPHTTASFNDGNLSYCTQYTYKVRALTCDTSDFSIPISVRTKYLPVTNLQASHNGVSVALSWVNPLTNPGFSRTVIVGKQGLDDISWNPIDGQSYSVGDSVGDAVVIYVGTDNSFVDNIPNPGFPYCYKAFACNNQDYYSIGVQAFATSIPWWSDMTYLTAYNNQLKVVARQNHVYLVYSGKASNNSGWYDAVIYLHSSDYGNTWDESYAFQVSNTPVSPTIALDNSGAPHIVWLEWYYDASHWKLVCKHAYNNGNGWTMWNSRIGNTWSYFSTNPQTPPFSCPSIPFAIKGEFGYCAVILAPPQASTLLEVFKFPLYNDNWIQTTLYTDETDIASSDLYRSNLVIDNNRVVTCYNKNSTNKLTIRWGNGNNDVIITNYAYTYNVHAVLEGNKLLIAYVKDVNNNITIRMAKYTRTQSGYDLSNVDNIYEYSKDPGWLTFPAPRIINSGILVFDIPQLGIYYSKFKNDNWITTNILSEQNNCYPQAFIAYQTLRVYWSKKIDCGNSNIYYLMSRSVNLSNYYVACDMATGPNNGTHLMRVPNTKELYMAFQEQNHIYCSHSKDEGENWETEEIGEGQYPCIGLNYTGRPWIAYVIAGDLFCKMKRPDGSWKEMLIYDGNETSWAGPPSMALATMPIKEGVIDYGYITYPVYEGTMPDGPREQPPPNTHSYIYISLFDTTGVNKITNLIDEGDADMPVSHPCIGVTPADLIHIAWQQKDEIWYVTNTDFITPENWGNVQWSEKYNLSQTGGVSEHPWVESYGDIVTVAWKEGAPGDIYKKWRYVWKPSEPAKWSDLERISNSPELNSDYPQMSTNNVLLWQEEYGDGAYQVFAKICDTIVCLTPYANNISFAHANALVVDPKKPEINVYYCYTDEITDGELYEVKFDKYLYDGSIFGEQEEVKYYEGDVGADTASPYCVERTGYIDYGDYSIDYGNQLEYLLKYLDPCMYYQLQAIVYQDTTGTIRQSFEVEDTLEATVRLYPAIPETINISISPSSYKEDLEAGLEILKTRGVFASVADFKLYEYEVINDSGGGGSGQQSAGMQKLPIPTMLQAPKPNPFANLIQIRFQIPIKTKVDLKIYNSTGRLVNTLINDEINPGYYTMSWNGRDEIGRTQSNGIYFIRLKTKDYDATKKMVLVR